MESIERWWNGLSLRGKLMISILTPSLLVASFMYQFSVQSIMANFNREYRSRALFIGQTLQDSISRGDLMRIDSLQATLEGLARNDDDLLRLTIYVRGSGNGTVLVSSDSSLMGSEASPNDLRPLVTGNAELTEEHDQGASFVEANVPLVIEGEPVGTMGVYLSLEARDALIRSQQINLLTIGGGGVIFMLFLVYFLTERLIVEPVARISRAASRIAAGELDVGLPELGADEVGRLASSVGKMVNQLLEDRRTMERLATTDGLTDLWNYRYFQDRLQEELDRAVRVEETLSVIIFDLDRFKAFNDTYGHVRGDEVLKAVGLILRSSVRPYDVPCRYGGEEFTVIAPGSDAEGAREIAERVRYRIASEDFSQAGGQKIRITASFGISNYPADAGSPRSLVGAADMALYASKGAGGNTVSVFDASVGCSEADEDLSLEGLLRDTARKKASASEGNSEILDAVLFSGPEPAVDINADQYQNRCDNGNIERPHDLA
ncbi:MAG: sensor domain-containing diguanylate cyclase [Dehalococcoidia bacterium]|nr:sensor domain-containing diguanylate cyclase [Dehalococcoidia bacterium]